MSSENTPGKSSAVLHERGRSTPHSLVPEGLKRILQKRQLGRELLISPLLPDRRALQLAQATRWQETTGREPQNSHFTLIMPIHNEERFLPEVLGTLMKADVPQDVNLNIVFVTNACNDRSQAIVSQFMQGIGEVERKDFEISQMTNFADGGLQKNYAAVKVGNITFTHVDTITGGKAHTLNIGNKIALYSGHRIAMNVDANNFLEPESLGIMFGQAQRSIVDAPDGIAALGGTNVTDMKPRKLQRVAKYVKSKSTVGVTSEDSKKLQGWFMAWDTEFVSEIGGIPNVMGEDYALGVLALHRGRKIQKVEKARIWGYESNSMRDRVKEYSRIVRGLLQLIEQYPEVAPFVEQDRYIMKPPRERIATLASIAKARPTRFPFAVPAAVVQEIALRRGKKEHALAPSATIWEPISSTKNN